MQHASSNPSSFVVWCRRQYVEASNSQTVEVLGLTDLTVFIPAHPTEIVQFVDGNFTILLQIPRDETSKKLVPCGQLGSECFMKFSLSVLHLIILKHVFLISHTSLQVNYCRIVEGQLEHWPLTQNVMLVLFLFVQSGHIASNLVPHLDSAWGCKVNFLDPSWGKRFGRHNIWWNLMAVSSCWCQFIPPETAPRDMQFLPPRAVNVSELNFRPSQQFRARGVDGKHTIYLYMNIVYRYKLQAFCNFIAAWLFNIRTSYFIQKLKQNFAWDILNISWQWTGPSAAGKFDRRGWCRFAYAKSTGWCWHFMATR